MATKQPSTLIEALNAFQQKYHAAGLDGKNPFFKSKYTTLSQALLAVQPATEFGLCHTQLNDFVMTPDGEIITIVITKLMHVSGDEPLISKFPVPKIPTNVKNVHQEAGSAQTYARRYGLLSVYGLANDDDDGNSLMKTPPAKTGVAKTPTKPNQKLEPTSVLEKVADPITKEAKALILEKLQALHNLHPLKMKELVEAFRKEFGIKDLKITRHITTAIQGEYLALAISKIDESL
jgi:hypothetical protein|tara:strand:+ start:25 stop:729 length:705 start_codon:yes stop_codon:yes gene_type:complete